MTKTLFKNGNVFYHGKLQKLDVLIEDELISKVAKSIDEGDQVIDLQGKLLTPGFVDLHVHLREPGFEHKETIATGTNRNTPKVKGLKEFEGKGISYCAICDGFFYKDKDVAVVGNGNYAIHEAETLKLVAKSVTILTNGKKMIENRDTSDFEVDETPIREFRGNNVINEVEFENNNTKKVDGVFIAIGTASSVDLARKIGAVIKGNNIVTNENMQTTVRKLYACGDCTGGLLQVNKAVYEGAIAALDIIKDLNTNEE